MRRALSLLTIAVALVATGAVTFGGSSANAAKPKKKPAPKAKAPPGASGADSAAPPEEPPPPGVPPKLRVEYATCPALDGAGDLAEHDAESLVEHLRRRCRNLRVPEGAAPTEIGEDELIVALCVREGADPGEELTIEAVAPKTCGLHATVAPISAGKAPISLVKNGELALSLRTSQLSKQLDLLNATELALVVGFDDAGAPRTERSPLIFRRVVEGYGSGKLVWFPMPMFTTDFSSSREGYRLGISPLAIALGLRFHPSGSSRAYIGTSAFVSWNLLVPNDTQTLSNGTFVRVNYKALGTGLLFDASGWIGVGVGLGRTFTTDARTDLRTWLYLGPRLLKLFTDL